MNFRHREERKNAQKEMKKSRIDRETLERFSKIREKIERLKSDETCLLNTYSTQNVTENKKAINI